MLEFSGSPNFVCSIEPSMPFALYSPLSACPTQGVQSSCLIGCTRQFAACPYDTCYANAGGRSPVYDLLMPGAGASSALGGRNGGSSSCGSSPDTPLVDCCLAPSRLLNQLPPAPCNAAPNLGPVPACWKAEQPNQGWSGRGL